MNLVFLGTPDFALPSLRALAKSRHKLLSVITRPDGPSGRGLRLMPPPVKIFAEELNLKTHQPEKLSKDIFEKIPDAMAVVAYGKIIPASVFTLPRYGCINLHPSLLPRWRGAAPVARAVQNGDDITGATTIFISEKLDAGDILLQRRCAIEKNDTTASLEERLSHIGSELLVETLDKIEAGEINPAPQDESLATYAPKLKKEEGLILWEKSSAEIDRHIRAMTKWPGAFTFLGGQRMKILRAEADIKSESEADAGTIESLEGDALKVRCRAGVLRIYSLQPEGRRPMEGKNFLSGRYARLGDRFGDA